MAFELNTLKKLISDAASDIMTELIWRLANEVEIEVKKGPGTGTKTVTFCIKPVEKEEKKRVGTDASEK
tara:strand:+ start:844 stop:1050 length:207 start_codon:yes stop_codon:yes gene_type:complete